MVGHSCAASSTNSLYPFDISMPLYTFTVKLLSLIFPHMPHNCQSAYGETLFQGCNKSQPALDFSSALFPHAIEACSRSSVVYRVVRDTPRASHRELTQRSRPTIMSNRVRQCQHLILSPRIYSGLLLHASIGGNQRQLSKD